MSDEATTALWKEPGLRAVCAVTSELSRHARALQDAGETSASLLAQALTAAELLGALQLGKSQGRINVQLECDGPLRGLFADADGAGNVRGYSKNPQVNARVDSADFRWRPALGNSGFLSVLRDLGDGESARSSVELVHFEIAQDLARYFSASEQIETLVALEVVAVPGEPLGAVAGVMVQPLPGGDAAAFAGVRARLRAGDFRRAVSPVATAAGLVQALIPGAEAELTARFPLQYHCSCSKERVTYSLAVMGRGELEDMLSKDGKAEVTCQFCATRYEVTRDELEALIAAAPRV